MPVDLTQLPDQGPVIDLAKLPDKTPGPAMPIEEQEKKAVFGKELLNESWEMAQEIGSLYPLAETTATVLTTFYGLPISGIAGLMALPANFLFDDVSAKVVETVQDWLIYHPQTEKGEALTGRAFYPFIKLDQIGNQAGNKVLEETNSPLAAAGVHALIAGSPAFIGLRGIPKAAMGKIQSSVLWRNMTIKERGLTVQRLHEFIERNPEATEGQIIRHAQNIGIEQLKEQAIEARRPFKPKVKPPKEEVAKPPIDLDKSLDTIRKDLQREVTKDAVKQGIPVNRDALLPYKGEAWADSALIDPDAILPDIPTDEEIDIWMQIQEQEIIGGEPEPGYAVETEIPDIVPIDEEPVSYDFKDHVQGYISELIEFVEIGERGRRLFIDKGPGEGGGRDVIGYKSTYPAWMLGQGWTAKQVITALKKGLKGEKLGKNQEHILLTALEEAQEMFVNDIIKYLPDAIEKAEATIDAAITELLVKSVRMKATRAHLRAVRQALKAKKTKGVKKKVRELSGQVSLASMVREDVALKAAMKNAAQAARKAYSAGKKETLAKERMRIRRLKQAAKVRSDQRKEFSRMVKKLRKVKTAKMDPVQAAPIRELLAGLDLVRLSKPAKVRLEKMLEFIEKNPEATVTEKMSNALDRLEKTHLNDMTLDELRDIFNVVMHHVQLDKLKKEIKVGRDKRDTAKTVNDSIKEMKPLKEIRQEIVSFQPEKPGIRTARLIKDTFGIRHDHYDLIIETLAGPNSIMDKVLFQNIKEGIIEQLKYRQGTFKKFQKGIEYSGLFGKDKKIPDVDKWLNETVIVGQYELTRNQRMSLYRHSLNTDNRTAILRGGFGIKYSKEPNKVYQFTPDEFNEIIDSLTTEELAFAGEHISDIFEDQANRLNDVFFEKNGYPMPREENYYPKEVMPIKRGVDFEKEEALEMFKGKWVRVGLSKGMLKERLGSKKPIYLNGLTYDVNKSVMRSAAYIGLEIPLSNASRLLYNPDFRYGLTSRYGEITWKEIEQGLRDIAGDWHSYSTVEELLMKTKNKIATAMLGLNPWVMMKQVASLPLYGVYIKPEYVMRGVIDYIFHPEEVVKRHKMFSPEYLERVEGGFSRDVADVAKATSEKRVFAGKKPLTERVMRGIKFFDEQAVNPGMQGAVLQVLDEFKAGSLSHYVKQALDMDSADIKKLSPAEKMQLAYKFADYVTERTQPMFSVEHRAPLSRGTPVEKLFTMFGAFTNQALNLMRRSYREAQRTKDPAAYSKLAKSIFYVLVVNTLVVMGIDEIRDRFYGRKGGSFLGRILKSWSGYVFFLRDLTTSVISKIEKGTFLGYDVSSPIQRPVELLANSLAEGYRTLLAKNKSKRKKAAKKFADNSLEFLFMTRGIPYQTPKKIIQATGEKLK